MKLLTTLVLLAGIVLAVIAWNSPPRLETQAREVPRSLQAEPAEGNVVHAFEVDGICCSSCPTSLREALSTLEGFSAVAVDPETGRVEIEASVDLSTGELAETMTFGKYVAHPLD